MPRRIQFRRGLAAEWIAENPVLAQGELGFETDTNKFKMGNGVDEWNDLDYAGGGGSGSIPIATELVLGGIKVGSGLTIDADGTLHSSASSTMVDGGDADEVYTYDQNINGGSA
jgi:hypothetical protein